MNRLVGSRAGGVVGGKRKAEASPKKGAPLPQKKEKRSALGDLTNAVKKRGTTLLGGGKEKVEKEALKKVVRASSRSKGKEEVVEVENSNAVELPPPSKLPIRQTRQSVKEEKEVKEATATTVQPRRVTRSSTQKEKAQEEEEVKKEVDESSDESLLYQTALSTPDTEIDVKAQNEKNEELSAAVSRRLPHGVIDFDAESGNDPFQVGLYAEDIFEYYRRREGRFIVTKYLEPEAENQQTELNKNMRSILVDWMVEVQESFELNHETMYLAVKLVDLFLGTQVVRREQLQLVGTTALYIAAKYDERCPPAIDDFCYICDDAYPQREIIRMEMVMLKKLNFDIGMPLSYRFLRRYSRCAKLDMETLTLARYLLELSLMEYDFVDVKDSMISAATLLLALVMKGVKDPWTKTLEHYSGYSKEDLFDITHRLHAFVSNVPAHLKTIKSKYSHKVFYEAAKVPLPDELKL